MLTIDLGSIKVWLASEFSPRVEEDFFGRHMKVVTQEFFRRRLFKEITELHAHRNNLQDYAVLRAHGGPVGKSRRYYFWDDDKPRLVQDWIDEVDGEFAALLILSCGTKRGLIRSKQSVVIHPTVTAGIIELINSQARLRLYLPGTGYLGDSHYRLRKAVNALKTS